MNKVFISGRIGQNIELKTGGNGTEYAKFSVAVNRRKEKDKAQKTDWFNCVAFGKTAAAISTYFKKGDGILISGRMEDDSYTDKNDNSKKIHSWNLNVENFEFPITNKDGAQKAESVTVQVSDDDIPF